MLLKPLVLVTAATLAGCAGVDVNHYRAEQPELKLESYFNGKLEAWGMFQKRNGEVVKRFKVEIDARWEGDKGVLDEQFLYSDGTTQRRVWRLIRVREGRYLGEAEDVVGVAEGEVSGNALHWIYTLRLPVDGKVYEVLFDDWMYLQEDGVMINRSVMRKFGFRLGEVILFFRKQP